MMMQNFQIPFRLPLLLALLSSFPLFAHGKTTQQKNASFYTIEISTQKEIKTTAVIVKTTGKAGYHCNTLYPWKLSVTPHSGIKMKNTVLKKVDAKTFTKEKVEFHFSYLENSSGPVSAKLKFSVCNDKQCLIEKVPLSWE
jgi:hypothetical protein